MSLDGERIVDTWIVSPTSTKNLFENTQTFFVSHAGFVSIRIEWLSFCSKSRAIYLEWRREEELQFSIVPSSSLFDAIRNVFEYEEPVMTFRINRYLSNHVLLDNTLIDAVLNRMKSHSSSSLCESCEPCKQCKQCESCKPCKSCKSCDSSSSSSSHPLSFNATQSPLLLYSTTDTLPQGISLDPYEGTLSGYPPFIQDTKKIKIVLSIRYENAVEEYFTFVAISLIGSFFSHPNLIVEVPSPRLIQYFWNDTAVQDVKLPVLQSVRLVPKTDADYHFFDIFPSLPRYLSFDPQTGVISGTPLFPLKNTSFTVRGHSIVSVVTCTITLEFTALSEQPMTGGRFVSINGELAIYRGNETVIRKEVSNELIYGIPEKGAYSVSLRNIE